MIPDARWFAPVNPNPTCDCLTKTKAAKYKIQYMCEQCEPLIMKLEREANDSKI